MLRIRRFKLPDLVEVMQIQKASFPKSQPYPKTYFLRYFENYPQGFLVAEDKRKILGYTIGDINAKTAPRPLGEIVSLAVSPESRQKGIGENLTDLLINILKKEGAGDVILNVRTSNKTALFFYKKIGFKIIKQVKKYYRNGDDSFVMKMNLDG